MKRFFITLFLLVFGFSVQAEDFDYEKTYRELPVPTHSYVHDIDPGEFYDVKDTSWTPYPLFRLTAPLHFKTITIEPGYYLLTPREHEDKWYMLFKEQGKVKYIIPVYEITQLADILVINSIEFWTGDNPIASNVGETKIVANAAGEDVQITNPH